MLRVRCREPIPVAEASVQVPLAEFETHLVATLLLFWAFLLALYYVADPQQWLLMIAHSRHLQEVRLQFYQTLSPADRKALCCNRPHFWLQPKQQQVDRALLEALQLEVSGLSILRQEHER